MAGARSSSRRACPRVPVRSTPIGDVAQPLPRHGGKRGVGPGSPPPRPSRAAAAPGTSTAASDAPGANPPRPRCPDRGLVPPHLLCQPGSAQGRGGPGGARAARLRARAARPDCLHRPRDSAAHMYLVGEFDPPPAEAGAAIRARAAEVVRLAEAVDAEAEDSRDRLYEAARVLATGVQAAAFGLWRAGVELRPALRAMAEAARARERPVARHRRPVHLHRHLFRWAGARRVRAVPLARPPSRRSSPGQGGPGSQLGPAPHRSLPGGMRRTGPKHGRSCRWRSTCAASTASS